MQWLFFKDVCGATFLVAISKIIAIQEVSDKAGGQCAIDWDSTGSKGVASDAVVKCSAGYIALKLDEAAEKDTTFVELTSTFERLKAEQAQ